MPTSTQSFKPPAMVPDIYGEGYISPYQQRMLGELVPPPATRVSGNSHLRKASENRPRHCTRAVLNTEVLVGAASVANKPCTGSKQTMPGMYLLASRLTSCMTSQCLAVMPRHTFCMPW